MTIGAAAAVAAVFAVASPAHAIDMRCQLSLGGSFEPELGPAGSSGRYQAPTAGLVNRSHCSFEHVLSGWAAPVTTRGTFTASSCGNAVLTGDPAPEATFLDFDENDVFGDLDGPIVWQMSYTIELRAWQGVVRVSRVNNREEHGGDDIDGVLTFVPQHGCLARGVETFTADGSVVLEW